MAIRVYNQSKRLIDLAKQYIPGGVNSPVRSFNTVGGTTVFFNHAKGAYLYDEDGNEYLDYVGSWGPMILGHQDPDVISALHIALDKALSFGAPTKIELEIAQKICALMPNIDMVRMQNSGTEATMTAIRLARGYTGRDLLIKFEGCYHGHSDSLLIKAGSGALTFGQTSSAGVPEDLAKHTLCLPYNNLEALSEAFDAYGPRIAAVIIEPVAVYMGCIPPIPGFLQHLRGVGTPARLAAEQQLAACRIAKGYPLPVLIERLGINTLFSQRQVDDNQLTALATLRDLIPHLRIVMDSTICSPKCRNIASITRASGRTCHGDSENSHGCVIASRCLPSRSRPPCARSMNMS